MPGPSIKEGFWSADSDDLMRRYIAVSPQGVTLEWAVEKTLSELQRSIRSFVSDPEPICELLGIDEEHTEQLI